MEWNLLILIEKEREGNTERARERELEGKRG